MKPLVIDFQIRKIHLKVTSGSQFGLTVYNKMNPPMGLNCSLNLINNLSKPRPIWVKNYLKCKLQTHILGTMNIVKMTAGCLPICFAIMLITRHQRSLEKVSLDGYAIGCLLYGIEFLYGL